MTLSSIRRFNVSPVILIWLMLPLLFFSSCRGSAAKEETPGDTAKTLAPREEEVRFVNGQTTLEGTLFWPATRADCPAVVVLAGSDRSRRGPLRMRTAKYFAAHNVAALVYGSPGTGASTGNALVQTRSERTVEALAESNHPDYEIEVFPNASLFLTVPGSATEFVPGYLDTMTRWLGSRVGLDNGGEQD